MASLKLWALLTLFSVCRAELDSTLILGELHKLTEAIASQKTEIMVKVEEMRGELKQEVQEMISETRQQLRASNDVTRNDVSTLKHLLDTDECAELTHNCSTDATCTDTMVSFRCKCKPGFSGDGYTCEDIDECEDEDICHPSATCRNTPGKYSCDCNPGFRQFEDMCEEIDECAEETHKCHKYAVCENTVGNYTCTCTIYHEGDGYDCERVKMEGCEPPFKAVPGIGCIHIIERSQTWNESRRECKNLGGDLFVAINAPHYLRLAKYFIDTNQADIKKYMWVGVKEGVWLNGRKVAPDEEAPRNPSMGSGTCSYTDGDTREKFLLWTDPCREDWWALCERKVEAKI